MKKTQWSRLPLSTEDWCDDDKKQVEETKQFSIQFSVCQGTPTGPLSLMSKLVALAQEHSDEVNIRGVLTGEGVLIVIDAQGPYQDPPMSFEKAFDNMLRAVSAPPQSAAPVS